MFAGLHQLDDVADILIEAHVQHLVGFVQHDLGNVGEVDAVVFVMVHQAAGGSDHNLAPLCKASGLLFHVGAAVDAGDCNARHKGREGGQLVSDLLGQLTGGGQNDRLRHLLGRVDLLGHRDAEGTGLACAGGSLGDDVPPRQHDGDGLFLNFGHFRKAHLLHSLVDGFAAMQFTVQHDPSPFRSDFLTVYHEMPRLSVTKRAMPPFGSTALGCRSLLQGSGSLFDALVSGTACFELLLETAAGLEAGDGGGLQTAGDLGLGLV